MLTWRVRAGGHPGSLARALTGRCGLGPLTSPRRPLSHMKPLPARHHSFPSFSLSPCRISSRFLPLPDSQQFSPISSLCSCCLLNLNLNLNQANIRHCRTLAIVTLANPPTSMKETSPDGPYIDRLRSWASSKVHGGNRSTARGPGPQHDPSLLPISSDPTRSTTHSSSQGSATRAAVSLPSSSIGINGGASDNGILLPGLAHDTLHSAGYETSKRHRGSTSSSSQNAGSHIDPQAGSQPSSSTQAARKGSQLRTKGPAESNEKTQADPAGPQGPEAQEADKGSIVTRFIATSRKILLHSWLNVLLIFVPVGIAVEFVPNVSPTVVFTMNAIAIIPLAGLLSHATETVAHRMGDAIGALLNITFGNAVELIILYVLCVSNVRTRVCLFGVLCVCVCMCVLRVRTRHLGCQSASQPTSARYAG
ncbi:hypothetical protein BD289DRAFT_41797 [Coniella lustricola]|uniref:Sodium/calcium exchanger protein-domain-containing protein n=1 Tax=Coniella lustricola TaxID=2025994 RepID=A0A2T3A209_9PEZI|nr:hypothetical protein BD289DRAFT_41797 [Coniella lustricola]